MIKKDEKIMQEINTEIYLKKKKIKRENMEGRNRYHNMSETRKLKLKMIFFLISLCALLAQ